MSGCVSILTGCWLLSKSKDPSVYSDPEQFLQARTESIKKYIASRILNTANTAPHPWTCRMLCSPTSSSTRWSWLDTQVVSTAVSLDDRYVTVCGWSRSRSSTLEWAGFTGRWRRLFPGRRCRMTTAARPDGDGRQTKEGIPRRLRARDGAAWC